MTDVSKKAFLLLVYIVALAMITMMWTSVAHAQERGLAAVQEAVVSQFLNSLQEHVIDSNNQQADKALTILECVENSTCADSDVFREKYREFRLYVAQLEFRDLEMRIQQMNQGYVVYSGLKLYFNNRTEQGRKEWSLIKDIHDYDRLQIDAKIVSLNLSKETREGFKIFQSKTNQRKAHYASLVSEYITDYPFFVHLTNPDPSNEDLAQAVTKMGRDFEKGAERAARLEGEERYELMGFLSSVDAVVEQFSPAQMEILSQAFKAKNESTKLIQRLKGIFTNAITLGFLACHGVGIAASVIPILGVKIVGHIMRYSCTAAGASMVALYGGQATIDIVRQLNLAKTPGYDRDHRNQYLRSYANTLIMTLIFVVPSLPALKSRGRTINRYNQLFAQSFRNGKLSMRRNRPHKFDVSTYWKETKSYGKSYAYYYLKDTGFLAGLRGQGQFIETVRKIEVAIMNALTLSSKRPVKVLAYGDLIAVL